MKLEKIHFLTAAPALLAAALFIAGGCGGDGGGGCPAGQTLCSGSCVDTNTSTAHCGTCGNMCPAGATCVGGTCQCPSGQELCVDTPPGVCVDTQTNADHCGGCNNQCSSGQQCMGGRCLTCTDDEQCDGEDNDCDGEVDENLTRDCSNPCGPGTETCEDGQWVNCTAPESEDEVCDGEDNDCDGQVDEGVTTRYYEDADDDGYGNPDKYEEACEAPEGFVEGGEEMDCDDTNADARPGNTERCDNDFDDTNADARPGNTERCDNDFDDNCDGTVNEGCTCTADETQNCGEGGDTGDCEWGTQTCGGDGTWGPCEGGTRPQPETCNGTDENCDGEIDNGLPEDSYEINDTCAQARALPRADEGMGVQTVDTASLYSTDGSDDTDWYTVEANEATHLDCIVHPGESQCYFYLDILLTPPSGADHENWSFCVHTGECGSWDASFCTDDGDWDGSKYGMSLYWSGICGLDDGWTFYIEVDGASGEWDCHPYELQYEFYFSGGIGGEYCT